LQINQYPQSVAKTGSPRRGRQDQQPNGRERVAAMLVKNTSIGGKPKTIRQSVPPKAYSLKPTASSLKQQDKFARKTSFFAAKRGIFELIN
jgi:hypothetical protein